MAGLSSVCHLNYLDMKERPFLFIRLFSNAFLRILVPPLSGLLFYGAWAYWVNMDYGQAVGLKAAATQGGYSFIITLVLALFIEWLYRLLKAVPRFQYWVAALACLLLYATSWGLNFLMGTPNIFLTILPGAIISTIYTVFYVASLAVMQARLPGRR